MNYYLLGLGEVGKAFLSLLKENSEFDPNIYYCIDAKSENKEIFVNYGGLAEHFTLLNVTKENYISFLKSIKSGDCLLDFSTHIKNLDILEYCLLHNIHYLFTADSSWPDDRAWFTIHEHFLLHNKLHQKYRKNYPTCVAEFGMNPGLISIFVKECINEIITNDNSLFIKVFRRYLKHLIKSNNYGKVAKLLKIELIEEVDIDTQKTEIPYKEDTIFSTWNVDAFYAEAMSSPEIAYAKNSDLYKFDTFFDVDINDQFISLYERGVSYNEISYCSKGEFSGHLLAHEEIFSIRNYLTYKKYRPTVVFVYRPCEYAERSLQSNILFRASYNHIISKKEIIDGGEEVGVIIQGKRFKTRYYSNYLESSQTINESATIRQVAVGAYAAFKYMQAHPNEGMLFPEDLDRKEIMEFIRKYLKTFISKEIPPVKPVNF